MFANNNMGVMNFAFPDVCKLPTPAGPIPIPLPNIAMSITHVPSQFRIIVGPGLAENLLTTGTVSNADEAGVALGMVSQLIVGPDRAVTCSVKVFVGGIPATHLTSVTAQNGMPPNAPGMSLTPAQIRVIYLT